MTKHPNPTSFVSGIVVIHIKYKGQWLDCYVDPEDYELVKAFRWNAKPAFRRSGNIPVKTFYAFTSDKTIYMHNMIAGTGHDHKNGNGLDNRRLNLRLANQYQQACNRRKRIDAKTSQYKGVYFSTGAKKWVAKINGKHIGYFPSETGAALAYNEYAQNLHGEFAVLNSIGG
jgi:hypothetical protein